LTPRWSSAPIPCLTATRLARASWRYDELVLRAAQSRPPLQPVRAWARQVPLAAIESPGSDSGPEVAAQNQTGAPLAAAAMMMREAGASKRKRGSCHFCRTHRIKCCRRRPCLNCLSRGFECVDAGGDVMVQVNGARRVVRQGDRDANGRARMRARAPERWCHPPRLTRQSRPDRSRVCGTFIVPRNEWISWWSKLLRASYPRF
jgi:hypothetical protein